MYIEKNDWDKLSPRLRKKIRSKEVALGYDNTKNQTVSPDKELKFLYTQARKSFSYMNSLIAFGWKPIGNPNVLRKDLLSARQQLLSPNRENIRILYPHETMNNLYRTNSLGGTAQPSGLVLAPPYKRNLPPNSTQNRYYRANQEAIAKKVQSVQNSLDTMPRG